MVPCPRCGGVTRVLISMGEVRKRGCMECKHQGLTEEVWREERSPLRRLTSNLPPVRDWPPDKS